MIDDGRLYTLGALAVFVVIAGRRGSRAVRLADPRLARSVASLRLETKRRWAALSNDNGEVTQLPLFQLTILGVTEEYPLEPVPFIGHPDLKRDYRALSRWKEQQKSGAYARLLSQMINLPRGAEAVDVILAVLYDQIDEEYNYDPLSNVSSYLMLADQVDSRLESDIVQRFERWYAEQTGREDAFWYARHGDRSSQDPVGLSDDTPF